MLLVFSLGIFTINTNKIYAAGTEESPDATVTCYINSNCSFDLNDFKDQGSDYGSGLRPLVYSTNNLDFLTITTTDNLDDNGDGNTKEPLTDGTIIYESIDMHIKGTGPSTGTYGFLHIRATDGAGNYRDYVYRVNVVPRYIFTFDADGGTGMPYSSFYVKSTVTSSNTDTTAMTIAPNAAMSEPSNLGTNYEQPTKDGYTFTGWYSDEATTTLYDWSTILTSNTTVYAGWQADYTLSYDGNGNTSGDVPSSTTVTKNAKAPEDVIVADQGNLAKEGYHFIGWNTAADGSGTMYQPGTNYSLIDNTTLYAQWTEDTLPQTISYSLTYDANGNDKYLTLPIPNSSNWPEGLKLEVVAPAMKAGYDVTFVGWNTKADGTGTMYQDGDVITINKDITLYAIVKVNTPVNNVELPKTGVDLSTTICLSLMAVISLGAYATLNKR
jgi:uncharacterized repeat protein (TIGR02543 family)